MKKSKQKRLDLDVSGIIALLFCIFLLTQADSYFQYIGAVGIILSLWRKK